MISKKRERSMPNGTHPRPNCSSCYYFESVMTQCRHDPPQTFAAPHGHSDWEITVWPHVNQTDWCGKHSDLHVIGGDSDESG